MNMVLSAQPTLLFPQHELSRRSPTGSASPSHINHNNYNSNSNITAHMNNSHNTMSNSRKRKADDDGDEMSVSPMSSPAVQNRQLTSSRPTKKVRSQEVTGRPLTLPRLLETLDAASLRDILHQICVAEPTIGEQVVKHAPKPSVSNALQVLNEYEDRLRAAFPYGASSSDYNYYRVKAPLVALLDALSDFTPQYLPPIETQASLSLQYLDGATKVIHNLPEWGSNSYRHHKENAYDDISRAWAVVINEAAKRGGGFALHSGGWDSELARHHHQSGGRLGIAMNAMAVSVGWVGGAGAGSGSGGGIGEGMGAVPPTQSSILNELISGTYGSPPVRVGH